MMIGSNGPGLIEIRHLSVAYDQGPALQDVNGCFPAGSLTAIVGPNGAGKSTLVKTLVGILRPSSGSVARHGLRARDVAYLPQAAEIERSFPITVSDTVALGAWRQTGAFGGLTREAADRIGHAIAAVGLDGFGPRQISTLSAGQFQRVLFARLLVQDARVIVLDEPFTAIDARTTRDLLDLVGRWHDERRTVVAVLHDFEQVRGHFPTALLLAREQIAWGATVETLSAANLLRARVAAETWQDDGREAA